MKHFILFFFLLSYSLSYSQVKEAYLQYHIQVVALDSSVKTKRTVALFRKSQMRLYFAPNKSRVDFKLGSLKTTSVIIDRLHNKALYLSTGQDGKYAQITTANKLNSKNKSTTEKVKVTNETKTILGYHCKKVLVIDGDVTATYWCTDEIKIDAQGAQIINPNLPSFPVMFSKVDNGIKMTFELSNFKSQIDQPLTEVFNTIPPDGYKIVKPKQTTQQHP